MRNELAVRRSPFEILSGSTLKIMAMAAMLIDHIGFVLVPVYKAYVLMPADFAGKLACDTVYAAMRDIGRSAFPLFCFLLCEGLIYTKSRGRQAARLFLFALASEVPFDLAMYGRPVLARQNVYFTLLIGYLAIWMMDNGKKKYADSMGYQALYLGGVLLAGMLAAEWLGTDYGGTGVLLICVLYLLRFNRILAGAAGYLCMLPSYWCLPAFLLIQGYNGKRGLRLKYVFYLFYPVHLLVLYLIQVRMSG